MNTNEPANEPPDDDKAPSTKPDPTVEVRFAAWLQSLDQADRLAVLHRLPFCFGCGAQPGSGEICICRVEA